MNETSYVAFLIQPVLMVHLNSHDRLEIFQIITVRDGVVSMDEKVVHFLYLQSDRPVAEVLNEDIIIK